MGTLVKNNGSFFPSVPSLFDDFFTRDLFNTSFVKRTEDTLPLVNIRENEDRYELEVAAPGMDKEDFSVEISNNVLINSLRDIDFSFFRFFFIFLKYYIF